MKPLLIYAGGRLLANLPSLFILSVFLFSLVRMVPGDPAAILLGDVQAEGELERLRAELGLDSPLPVQYALWLGNILQGDLGHSFLTGQAVLEAIVDHFAVTLQVVGIAFVIAVAIAVPAGMAAARHQNRAPDTAIVGAATLMVSVPSFWVAMLLSLVFAAHLGWLPALGYVPLSAGIADWARHIVMPVTALVFVDTAILTRLMRASTIEVLSQDYIAYARAKGLAPPTVLWRHTLRNALSPVLTMMGLILGSLLSGAAVIETMFGLPGLGRLLVDAIYARDYPLIQGTLMFIVVIYMGVNLLVDLLYPLLDPRVALK